MLRWCQARPFRIGICPVVPKPIFARLEAADDRVTRRVRMRAGVLAGRVVAASNVTALRTPSEMEPPTSRGEALHATGPAWWHLWI